MTKQKKSGLARVLSKMGYCSRSQAAELIRGEKVTLNGRIVRDPETPTRINEDRILINGSAVQSQSKVYFMMNKPFGIVTTAADEKGRATVYDFLDALETWVGPVGRLDK